jgi:hypothetical protein
MRPSAIWIAASLLCAPAFAGDREFDSIVRTVEARYDTSRTHIPLFGVANFFVKVVRPAGASDLKLVCEDLNRPMFNAEEDFTALVRDSLGPRWRPFVRVHDRRRGQWTCIYSNFSGGQWKLLIASLERHEAAVIRIRLNPRGMSHWVEQPRERMRNRASD